MKIRTALLSLALALPTMTLAASWDGVRSGMTVITVTSNLTTVSASVPVFPYLTLISVLPSDRHVNNIRITIQYRDDFGNLKRAVAESDASPALAWITTVFPLRADQIVGEPYIEARVVSVTAAAGSPL